MSKCILWGTNKRCINSMHFRLRLDRQSGWWAGECQKLSIYLKNNDQENLIGSDVRITYFAMKFLFSSLKAYLSRKVLSMDNVNYEYLLNYTIFSSLQHYSDHFMRQYKGKWSIIIKMGSHVTRFKRDLIIWYQIEFTAIRALMTLPWVTMTIITNSAHDMRNAIVS